MGAGTYVGRVGGLAIALGIGAAVFVGAGTASADDAGGSEAKTKATTSASSEPAASPKADASKPDTESKAEEAAGDSAEDGSDEAEPAEETEAEPTRPRSKRDAVKPSKSSDVEEQPAADEEPAVEEQAEDAPAAEAPPVAEEPAAVEPPETVVEVEPAVEEEIDPVEVVTKEIAAAVPEIPADDTGDPVLPALASLFTSILSAGREATNESPTSVGEQVSTSLAEAKATQYPIPTGVKVEEWTPPLEWLQKIPVLGPLVVTPIVGVIHVIPLVGDIIHPVIGYPIDHFAPPGTPRARSFRVTSFDGTRIFVNFMPAKGLKAGEKAPTVLNGPGLGLPGSTALELPSDSFLPNDVIGIGTLRENGYNVVTWDPRGEWRSEGRMQLQSPDYEGRDISHLISVLATMPEVALDDVNDPKIGMTGASYGGGIQLATAAIDHRVDAIVPTIAWNRLNDVLFADESVRSGWGTLLSTVLVLTLSRPNERILPAAIVGILTGQVDPDDLDLLDDRGYADQLADITAPTLLIQGTVDTLFTLGQADANAKALIDAGTITKVMWYCGGHGACLSDFNDGEQIIGRTLNWLDRYVKDEDVDTGDQFEWVDQNGDWFSSETYPVPNLGTPIVAQRNTRRTIPIIPFLGGSGPNPLIVTRGLVPIILGLPSATGAVNAVSLRVPDVTETTHIVGAPELTLTYSGNGTAKHVYAQIVDDKTGLVLGNHVIPVPVTLDGGTHTVTVPMELVAHTLAPGQSVTVQVVASAINFLNFYSWGAISVEEMSVSLPTLAAVGAVASGEPVAAA
ncbi:CocE/NonD family hydrolase [Mycobacterium sp. 236(2023)]|uniref:S15 peptidase family protein n=1 Tax=Mycobacterium sp. 236(2023) TaxID=3038163 RepID=UPI0024157A13|nr:CocE/NonD family hydrolase [Mycobacterium sp. 236(2023)]MDG4663657.1 CocE/NonD family hydrolase [Mycobacterium sp. 236(2023)]